MTNLNSMTPDEVCGWIQGRLRRLFGDNVENRSDVYASHGYYYIKVRGYGQLVLRRPQLPKFEKRLVKGRRGYPDRWV